MNWESQPLQPHEIEGMSANTEIIERVVRSYEMMLDFYGMRLLSRETGLLGRSLPPRDYESRYKNLVSEYNLILLARLTAQLMRIPPQFPLTTIFVSHASSNASRSWILSTST